MTKCAFCEGHGNVGGYNQLHRCPQCDGTKEQPKNWPPKMKISQEDALVIVNRTERLEKKGGTDFEARRKASEEEMAKDITRAYQDYDFAKRKAEGNHRERLNTIYKDEMYWGAHLEQAEE